MTTPLSNEPAKAPASPSPILIVAATRWEARPLAAALGLAGQSPDSWSGSINQRDIKLILTGMGGPAVLAALDRQPPPSLVISTGFAGALQQDLKTGDVVVEELTPCPQEAVALRLDSQCIRFAKIAHADHPLRLPAEKLALGKSVGAPAVDMESDSVRKWAKEHGLKALAVRVILDEASYALPQTLPRSEAPLALAGYALANPQAWPRLAGLWCRQRKAAKALCFIVKCLLERI